VAAFSAGKETPQLVGMVRDQMGQAAPRLATCSRELITASGNALAAYLTRAHYSKEAVGGPRRVLCMIGDRFT
jgi:hypothetical protein